MNNLNIIQAIIIENLKGDILATFNSPEEAAIELKINRNTVVRYANSGKPFRSMIFKFAPKTVTNN